MIVITLSNKCKVIVEMIRIIELIAIVSTLIIFIIMTPAIVAVIEIVATKFLNVRIHTKIRFNR